MKRMIVASTKDEWKEMQQAAQVAADLQELEHEFELDRIEEKVLETHGITSLERSTDGEDLMLHSTDGDFTIDYQAYEDAVKSLIVECTSFEEFEQEYDEYIQSILE